MERQFVFTIDDLKQFLLINKDKIRATGNVCHDCYRYKKCIKKSKESYIESILYMNQDATRFPGLLKYVQSNRGVLDLVPSWIYQKAYGLFSSYLPCQFNTKLISDSFEKISSVYHLLSNECSKLTFLNVLMYRLTLEMDYIYRAYSMIPQYFIPAFCGNDANAVFVDCGAYIGDSFENYCIYNQEPHSAYFFEPDPKNLRLLETVARKHPNTKCCIIDKGVYKTSGYLYFVGGKKISSRFSEVPIPESELLAVTSIDDSISEKISFIKMDIEGSEKDAILGAREIILKYYPKLAICVYHSPSDLWDIPIMIHDLFPKYAHFEMYHHSTTFAETVLYVY